MWVRCRWTWRCERLKAIVFPKRDIVSVADVEPAPPPPPRRKATHRRRHAKIKSTSSLVRMPNISQFRCRRATVSGPLVLSNPVPIGPRAHQPLPAPGRRQNSLGQVRTTKTKTRSRQGSQPRRLVIRTCRPNRETCRCTAEVQSAGARLCMAFFGVLGPRFLIETNGGLPTPFDALRGCRGCRGCQKPAAIPSPSPIAGSHLDPPPARRPRCQSFRAAFASSPTLVACGLSVSTLSLHFSLLQRDDPPAAPGKKKVAVPRNAAGHCCGERVRRHPTPKHHSSHPLSPLPPLLPRRPPQADCSLRAGKRLRLRCGSGLVRQPAPRPLRPPTTASVSYSLVHPRPSSLSQLPRARTRVSSTRSASCPLLPRPLTPAARRTRWICLSASPDSVATFQTVILSPEPNGQATGRARASQPASQKPTKPAANRVRHAPGGLPGS
jgi:hypothetical protein